MSITIYEKTPSGLYATGDRTVSTFPSGLIRVDQIFVCRTSAAATNRATLAVGADMPGDSYPATDGLKIFPEPQEKRRGDGFTEFIVSAYGRIHTNGITTVNKKPNTVDGLRYVSDTITYIHTFTQENPVNYGNYLSNTDFIGVNSGSNVRIQRYENATIEVKLSETTTQVYTSDLMFVVYRNRLYYLYRGSLYSEMKSYQENNYGYFKEATVTFEPENLELMYVSSSEIKAE